jgi:hypothetical protein
MKDSKHIYTIELTKRQAELLSYACDQFSRLIIGQDWSYQELFEAAWEKRCKEAVGGHGMDNEWDGGWYKMREDAEAICKQIKQRFWGLDSRSMYGIHYDDVADILFALHTVIRHQLWLDKPEDKKSHITVDSDEPMRIGSEPLALIGKKKSLWHDSNKEQPDGKRYVLLCDIERQCDIAKYVKVNRNHIWAYLEDLVPDFKNVINP